MLKNLRVQLTLIYLLSSILLALLVGGGAYSLVKYYFQSTNDDALKVKVGVSLLGMRIPLPAEIQKSMQHAGFIDQSVSPQPTPIALLPESMEELNSFESANEHAFERTSSLADIYVLPLSIEGQLVTGFGSQQVSLPINLDAIKSAEITGSDLRTFVNPNGIQVRLYTVIVNNGNEKLVFQAGRFLESQQEVMRQLMETMVIAGGVVTLFFGLVSWLLAGRTIKTSQVAWDKQQTFVANASHELRAPLTLIHAGIEYGLRKTKEEEQRKLLTDVLSDADYMKKLIEDLLLLSRLDAHSLKFEVEPIEISQFIEDLTRQMSLVSENHDIKIENKLIPIRVLADKVRMQQVLLIILDNALRNSQPGGSIQINTKNKKSLCEINITDHGQGISEKDIEKVFDRFYKVDDRSTQEYRGSGLGLSIAKSLLEGQRGSIEITSKPGEWTTVTITLPVVN